MMGWLWSGPSNSLDEQMDKATSSSLEDIALNLEISDVIRSKTVPPKEAMRSLKRRIDNKNPNTQLSALNLADTCVKNGGSHFLTEIASREFMDNLISLIKATGPAAVDIDVRSKILELIQSWATATEGRHELAYIGEVYRTLKQENYQFPPRRDVASTMIDSCSPPEWIDSEVCMRCRSPFTFTNRKHHCRNCGSCFDHQCSSKTLPLPHLGILQPVRVDDGCYAKLTDKSSRGGTGSANLGQQRSPNKSNFSTTMRPSNSMTPRSARGAEDRFDDDLKKALAMSLEEIQGHSRGYVAPARNAADTSRTTANPQSSPPTRVVEEEEEEEAEEDADLKAAIAASLADMEEQKKKHAAALQERTAHAGGSSSAAAPFTLPKNDYELTPVEAENINLFSTLVDRLQTQPPGTILREPQIQELYDSIGTLRPKLARTYGETMSKHDALLDLHAKLSTVVRYYDRMLEDQLSKAYSQHSYADYHLPAPHTTSNNPYPSIPTSHGANMASAESFYLTEQPATVYGRSGSFSAPHGQPSAPHAPPPAQLVAYDTSSAMNSQPNGHGSLQQGGAQPSAPSSVGRDLPATHSVADAHSYYYNTQALVAPQAPPMSAGHASNAASSPYPAPSQQSMQSFPVSLPNTPAAAPAQPQPVPQQASPQQQQQQPQPQPQQHQNQAQPYWQHSAAQQTPLPPVWQAQPNTGQYTGYLRESFPSAPHHAPQQPVVEESLIEL